MKTFIKMLAAVTNPVAIERGYQIFAAKRDLLNRQAEKTTTFAHSYMEPRPLETKCPDMVDLHHVTTKSKPADNTEAGEYKLAPSLDDVRRYRLCGGKFVLRLRCATSDMVRCGFYTGQVFEMMSVGYQRSKVRSLNRSKMAIINNKYLESVFLFNCGCTVECCCSARNR